VTELSVLKERALVLGGGGVAGIAWEIGVLAGLVEQGTDLAADAALIIGTSAGSSVGALVASGADYEELMADQRVSAEETLEFVPEFDLDLLVEMFSLMMSREPDRAATCRRIGALAVAAPTVPESRRRAVIAARLKGASWPERPVLVVAVDALSGERVVFDARSSVSLIDAVAASCAVPGVWPPVSIGGRRYIDGGASSVTNVDLAEGFDKTVVLCPLALGPGAPGRRDGADEGGSVFNLVADAEALDAFGPNLLDPGQRGAALEAGLRQGRSSAEAVRLFWSGPARA
jgi:NTE family protein